MHLTKRAGNTLAAFLRVFIQSDPDRLYHRRDGNVVILGRHRWAEERQFTNMAHMSIDLGKSRPTNTPHVGLARPSSCLSPDIAVKSRGITVMDVDWS